MKALPFLLILIFTGYLLQARQDTLPARVYHLSQLASAKDSSRDRVQLMDGPTSVLSNLEAHLTILEPGKAAHPPHTHSNQEELIIVKEGLLKVTVAGKSKTLSAGGVAYSLPGDEHGAVNAGRGKASYYIVKYTTRKPVNAERGAAAGGSIIMDWKEPIVDKTDRGERRQFYNRPTSLFEKFDMRICIHAHSR
jgi:(S)-ureidoglycine aminohydrolase